MRVARFDTRHYRIPREVWWGNLPVSGSRYSISSIELVTCEVETDDGFIGTGFTYTVGHGGAGVHAILLHELGPELVARGFSAPEAAWSHFWDRLHWVGRGGLTSTAIAAADIALWDACAKIRGLPLYRLLGAYREAIPAYGSGVNLGYGLDDLLQEVRAFRAAGFEAVKIKVGRSAAEDVERTAAVRDAIGRDCLLMVDANLAWTLAEAVPRLKALEPFGIEWLEEPLAPEDVAGHAALQQSTPVPLAAGESLFTPWEFADYFRAGAIRIAQPDVTRLGVTGWLKVARVAEAFHVPLAPHFVPDIHVHLACAVPNAIYVEYLPWFERLQTSKLELSGGTARPSSTPGHGVVFDNDLLDEHMIDGGTS